MNETLRGFDAHGAREGIVGCFLACAFAVLHEAAPRVNTLKSSDPRDPRPVKSDPRDPRPVRF